MLCGLLSQTSGSAKVAGFDIVKDSLKIRSIVGLLPESSGFYNWMSAEEYLLYFAALYKVDTNLGKKRAIDLLEKGGDIKNKIPIDSEDWSAEKGLYIPSIEAGQALPLEWNVRLVKAGSYTIDLLFNKDGDFASPPSASSKVFLEVAPKLNLNPSNVLPVAFGVSALIMGVLGIRGRARKKDGDLWLITSKEDC